MPSSPQQTRTFSSSTQPRSARTGGAISTTLSILLLGQQGAGKTTVLKQFRRLYDAQGHERERHGWRLVIFLNIITAARLMLERIEENELRSISQGTGSDESTPSASHHHGASGGPTPEHDPYFASRDLILHALSTNTHSIASPGRQPSSASSSTSRVHPASPLIQVPSLRTTTPTPGAISARTKVLRLQLAPLLTLERELRKELGAVGDDVDLYSRGFVAAPMTTTRSSPALKLITSSSSRPSHRPPTTAAETEMLESPDSACKGEPVLLLRPGWQRKLSKQDSTTDSEGEGDSATTQQRVERSRLDSGGITRGSQRPHRASDLVFPHTSAENNNSSTTTLMLDGGGGSSSSSSSSSGSAHSTIRNRCASNASLFVAAAASSSRMTRERNCSFGGGSSDFVSPAATAGSPHWSSPSYGGSESMAFVANATPPLLQQHHHHHYSSSSSSFSPFHVQSSKSSSIPARLGKAIASPFGLHRSLPPQQGSGGLGLETRQDQGGSAESDWRLHAPLPALPSASSASFVHVPELPKKEGSRSPAATMTTNQFKRVWQRRRSSPAQNVQQQQQMGRSKRNGSTTSTPLEAGSTPPDRRPSHARAAAASPAAAATMPIHQLTPATPPFSRPLSHGLRIQHGMPASSHPPSAWSALSSPLLGGGHDDGDLDNDEGIAADGARFSLVRRPTHASRQSSISSLSEAIMMGGGLYPPPPLPQSSATFRPGGALGFAATPPGGSNNNHLASVLSSPRSPKTSGPSGVGANSQGRRSSEALSSISGLMGLSAYDDPEVENLRRPSYGGGGGSRRQSNWGHAAATAATGAAFASKGGGAEYDGDEDEQEEMLRDSSSQGRAGSSRNGSSGEGFEDRSKGSLTNSASMSALRSSVVGSASTGGTHVDAALLPPRRTANGSWTGFGGAPQQLRCMRKSSTSSLPQQQLPSSSHFGPLLPSLGPYPAVHQALPPAGPASTSVNNLECASCATSVRSGILTVDVPTAACGQTFSTITDGSGFAPLVQGANNASLPLTQGRMGRPEDIADVSIGGMGAILGISTADEHEEAAATEEDRRFSSASTVLSTTSACSSAPSSPPASIPSRTSSTSHHSASSSSSSSSPGHLLRSSDMTSSLLLLSPPLSSCEGTPRTQVTSSPSPSRRSSNVSTPATVYQKLMGAEGGSPSLPSATTTVKLNGSRAGRGGVVAAAAAAAAAAAEGACGETATTSASSTLLAEAILSAVRNAGQGSMNNPAALLAACKDDILSLWKDPLVIRQGRLGKVHSESDVQYLMTNLDRIVSPDFVPSDEDIMHARVRTLGVTEELFTISPSLSARIYDVGGSTYQRKAWSPFFHNKVDAFIFLAPLSAYNQTLNEDPSINRLWDSLQLFGSIMDSPLMRQASVVLFLNKIDVLAQKLRLAAEAQAAHEATAALRAAHAMSGSDPVVDSVLYQLGCTVSGDDADEEADAENSSPLTIRQSKDQDAGTTPTAAAAPASRCSLDVRRYFPSYTGHPHDFASVLAFFRTQFLDVAKTSHYPASCSDVTPSRAVFVHATVAVEGVQLDGILGDVMVRILDNHVRETPLL